MGRVDEPLAAVCRLGTGNLSPVNIGTIEVVD